MKWGVVWWVLAFYFSIFLLPCVLADFQYYNNTIKTDYLGGELLQGMVKIKLDSVPAHTEITSSFQGSIGLLELLKKQNLKEGVEYNCSTLNCLPDYAKSNQSPISSLSIWDDESKIAGFYITGKNVEVEKIELLITSNTDKSCVRDLLVDVGDNGSAFLQSDAYIGESCEPVRRGCFDEGLDEGKYQLAEIGNQDYCENITLPPASAYKVGARVVNSTSGVGDIKMEIFDMDRLQYGSCVLPKHNESIQTLSCIINHTGVFTKDYFACISSSGGNYKIKFEQSGRVCGSDQMNENNFDKDYDVFAQTMKFDYPVINVGEGLFSKINGGAFAEYVNNYISDRHGKDCSLNGCFVPFSIKGKAQELLFRNQKIRYRQGMTLVENDRLYALERRDAVISSGVLNLDLNKAGFVLPILAEQETLQIYFGGRALFDKPIPIEISPSFSFDVLPRFALIGSPTTFNAFTNDNSTIISTLWKFGDGNSKSSSENNVVYAYGAAGTYNVEVTAQKADGTSARKVFSVLVGDPKSSAESLLERYEKRISNLNSNISNFPAWIKKEINKKLDLISLGASLTKFRNEFSLALKDEDYAGLVGKLLSLDVPLDVAYTETGNFPLSLGFENIDASYVEELTGKKAEDENKLKESIINWISEYYDASVEKQAISLFRDNRKEGLVSVFSVKLKPKKTFGGSAYLIMNYPLEGIAFKEDYSQKSVGSGSYVPVLSGKEHEISFVVSDSSVNVQKLGMYVGSEDAFSISKEAILEEEKFKLVGFLVWGFVLVIGLVAIYLVLQLWYKKYYENYLFSRRDDMYNLILFIKNSRDARIDDTTIRAKLRGAGWNGEQISYAFKKLDGGRVGMWEIPVFKWFENRKVQEEINKRQGISFALGKPPSARFIKQSGFS